jgi:hypothetical protein
VTPATASIVLIRLPVSTVLALAAVGKAIRFPASAQELWVPWSPGAAAALSRRAVLLTAVVAELIASVAFLVAPGPMATAIVLPLLGVLTAYGWVGLRRTGKCGCWGSLSGTTSQRHLVVRNLALGALAIAAYPTHGLIREDVLRDAAPLLGFVPLLMLVLVTATGSLRALRGRGA